MKVKINLSKHQKKAEDNMYFWTQNLAKANNKHWSLWWTHFRGKLNRFSWEVCFYNKNIALELNLYDGDNYDDIQLHIGLIFISIWFSIHGVLKPKDYQARLNGISIHDWMINIKIWKKAHEWNSDGSSHILDWSFFLPFFNWEFQNDKEMVMMPDGSWSPIWIDTSNQFTTKWHARWNNGVQNDLPPDGRWNDVYSYSYKLNSGIVQHVKAWIFVERMQWRRKWFEWCSWPWFMVKNKQSIEIAFSDEVGERSGSWKGGVLGCSYEMEEGERPQDTLRRMERNRKFK